jgi:predicted phage tail protein
MGRRVFADPPYLRHQGGMIGVGKPVRMLASVGTAMLLASVMALLAAIGSAGSVVERPNMRARLRDCRDAEGG